eukprot:98056_1
MASNQDKKRSFKTFESNQNDIQHSAKKKPRNSAHKKHKKKKNRSKPNFFDIKFSQPDDLNKEDSHCLEFHNLLSFMQEHNLYGLIKNELKLWYESKAKNKSANPVPTDGKMDIHLFHNRHNSGTTGFAYVYFENKSDASYILQLSNGKKLQTKYGKPIQCEWRQNAKDRDSYSSIYLTDTALKGETTLIKISNLHWKTTLLHLHTLFNSLNPSAEAADSDQKQDFDPRWMKIMEDKNGFPKCQSLVMLQDTKHAVDAVEQLQGRKVLGRKLKLEYSSYVHEGSLLTKYNEDNLQLGGVSHKLLLSNIKQSVKRSDVIKFLKVHVTSKDNNVDEMVKDVYLMHNVNRICGGKCFVEFDTVENAKMCLDLLQFKPLCDRTVLVEYGHIHNDHEEERGGEGLRGQTNRLFMSNLAWDVKEKDIKRFFGKKVVINSVYFNVTAKGFPKGSAFITFQGFDVASKAFDQSNGKKLKNRVVVMDFAQMLAFANENDNNNVDADSSVINAP